MAEFEGKADNVLSPSLKNLMLDSKLKIEDTLHRNATSLELNHSNPNFQNKPTKTLSSISNTFKNSKDLLTQKPNLSLLSSSSLFDHCESKYKPLYKYVSETTMPFHTTPLPKLHSYRNHKMLDDDDDIDMEEKEEVEEVNYNTSPVTNELFTYMNLMVKDNKTEKTATKVRSCQIYIRFKILSFSFIKYFVFYIYRIK